jgi:PAS domain S-box-containing protein
MQHTASHDGDAVGEELENSAPGAGSAIGREVAGPTEIEAGGKTLHVLILEDQATDAQLLVRELRRAGYAPEWKRVDTETDFLAEIKNLPDIILSDYAMPQFSGMRAVELLQDSGLNIPFILISGTVGEEVAVEAIQQGATDYLLKDRLERLGLAVERALEQKHLREGRALAKEALLKAGALQSAIFNSANFSCIATDAKGVIQIFNVGAERMLGYAAADVMNQITPADISDPQEVIARARALSTELETPITPGFEALVFKASRGIEDIYELTYIRKDGSRFPAVVSVTALRDAQEGIIGYLLIGTDNTARKEVEEERKKLDQRLRDQQFYTRSLIESNIDALMTTDPLGIITDVNKQMEELTGCTRDELIGAPFKEFFTDPERAESGIKLVLIEKKVTEYELTARARDGRETVVSYNATTFYDRHRKLQGVFAAARDVTERKRFEQTLQEKNVEMENANLAKDRFLASMSHELRTPLNAIIGFTGTLLLRLPGPLNSEQEDQLQTIKSSARHQVSLINDLLDLAKIESGKVKLNLQPMDAREVVGEVATALGPLAETKGLTLEVNGSAVPMMVQTDRRALSQILINLTNNAIKFSDAGRVRIDLRRRNGTMELTVEDTGIGIDPIDQTRLFEAFARVENTVVEREEGTGLGLHLSQKLAGLLGGRITFTSQPGVGSAFKLSIPNP